ncbi:MAG TPA: hypothetical protein VMW91_01115 [Desulfosporosinus sp.]|nr:hypothetical protein [Desulfosporosinus sp.]
MADISKEELLAMIEVQSKSAASMESIANSMKTMAEQYKELLASQQEMLKTTNDGRAFCRDKICEVFKKEINTAVTPIASYGTTLNKTYDAVKTAKIFIGVVALAIIVVTVVLRFSGPHDSTDRIEAMVRQIHLEMERNNER